MKKKLFKKNKKIKVITEANAYDQPNYYTFEELYAMGVDPFQAQQVLVDGQPRFLLPENVQTIETNNNFNNVNEQILDYSTVGDYPANYQGYSWDNIPQEEPVNVSDEKTVIQNQLVIESANKKLWKPNDVIYKVYNVSYNQNKTNKDLGCLYNVSFDIFPGDRIALLASDSISDRFLIEILKNNIAMDSGYIFFNLKREHKWYDIFSDEYNAIDVDLYNSRHQVIYQLQSPDYFAYGASKHDTVSSTFKKFFNSISFLVNNSVYENLVYLLNLHDKMKKNIHTLDELEKARFTFICDVLIGKKIILFSNLTYDFDINQKISFFRYINSLFQGTDVILIFTVKDTFEVKLLSNRLLIIDEGVTVVDKKVVDILKVYNSLDTFIYAVFDKIHKRIMESFNQSETNG